MDIDTKKMASDAVDRAFAPVDLVFALFFAAMSLFWLVVAYGQGVKLETIGQAELMAAFFGYALSQWRSGRK